jgi:hypothetical protein
MTKHVIDPLEMSNGSITRVRGKKKFKKALNGVVQHVWAKMDLEEQVAPMELKRETFDSSNPSARRAQSMCKMAFMCPTL